MDDITAHLLESGDLVRAVLKPQKDSYRPIPRYAWRGCTPLELASTIKETGYLSHGTAMFLHGLTEQVPRTFYVNKEQTPKPAPSGALVQANIDRAFKAKQRASKYIFGYAGSRFVLLSGKNTRDHGVETMVGPSGEPQRVTNLERTLIDIAVRPAYSGGLVEVLGAYEAARGSLSVERLVRSLEYVNHFYPYHQAIGFLMERAGFDTESLRPLKALGTEHDFYLMHGMKAPRHNPSWRVFYPDGF
ncbi:MAG: type IV toxin-antitoxin system AbiEi family antitoxin [Planctomycetota bacterium]